jgi:hypothetical protein
MNGLRHGIFSSDAVLYDDPSGQHLAHEIERLTSSLFPQNDREHALVLKNGPVLRP